MEQPLPPSSSSPSTAPELIGGCRLLRLIGRGGSAEVYEAEHIGLAKHVAVKLLRRELCAHPLSRERTRFEAQSLARLQHPNIPAISDCGHTADGRPFMVMELLQGRSLQRELRRRGSLPVQEAVEIAQQVLAGLGAAHALGIVHRDVKPANLFVCVNEHGRRTIKILDFGIAKAMPGAVDAGAPPPPTIPTEEGFLLGTPSFLSPEQILCQPVDARTDVYGTALVLYEMLSGRNPFEHTSQLELLEAHVSERPRPPSALASQPIPPELDDVVLRGLKKKPDDRWSSTEDFSWALGMACARVDVAPLSVTSAPRATWVAPLLVMIAAAVISALATLGFCQVW